MGEERALACQAQLHHRECTRARGDATGYSHEDSRHLLLGDAHPVGIERSSQNMLLLGPVMVRGSRDVRTTVPGVTCGWAIHSGGPSPLDGGAGAAAEGDVVSGAVSRAVRELRRYLRTISPANELARVLFGDVAVLLQVVRRHRDHIDVQRDRRERHVRGVLGRGHDRLDDVHPLEDLPVHRVVVV